MTNRADFSSAPIAAADADPAENAAPLAEAQDEAHDEAAISSAIPAPRTHAMTQAEVDAMMRTLPALRKGGAFYAFSFPNFRLFFYGQLISVAGTWMQDVAQKWLVWDITHEARWLGIVSGASAIPYVLFSVWGGQAADRYPRRTTLVITQALMMLLAFALAALAGWDHGTHLRAWHVAVLAALSGIVNAYNMPAQQAFVTDMVDDRDALANAIALNSLRFNVARVLGPVFAGAVLVWLGSFACFAINGLSYIAVIISLLLMRLPAFVAKAKDTSLWEGFHYIRANVSVLRVVLLVGAASLMAWSASTLFPAFAAGFFPDSKAAANAFSRLMTANGIGAALAGIALTVVGERIPRRTLVYGGALFFAAFLLMLAASSSYGWALASLVGSGFFMIIFGISANTKVQSEVPDALRGRVMAVYSLVFGGLMPVGGLEMGFLAQHLTADRAVGINAAAFAVISILLVLWSWRSPGRAAPRQDRGCMTEEDPEDSDVIVGN